MFWHLPTDEQRRSRVFLTLQRSGKRYYVFNVFNYNVQVARPAYRAIRFHINIGQNCVHRGIISYDLFQLSLGVFLALFTFFRYLKSTAFIAVKIFGIFSVSCSDDVTGDISMTSKLATFCGCELLYHISVRVGI